MESLALAVPLSILFYFIWNALAPTYFYFLPEIYKQLPFWHCMGLFVILGILRAMLFPGSFKTINKTVYKK